MKKNWITLDSETFLWVKGEEGLLYNTQNKSSFHFANKGEVNEICKDLLEINNLYSAEISNNQLQNEGVVRWMDSIVANEMGYLTFESTLEERPVSLMPILKIQDDIQRYIWEYNRGIQGEILNNLHNIFFYINGSTNNENELYKQITYPFKTDLYLDYHDIMNFCRNSQNPFLSEIHLIGSLFTYPSYQNLLDELELLHIQLVMIVTDTEYLDQMQAYTDVATEKNITIQIMVRNINCIEKLLSNQGNLKNNHYHFLISSKDEYECTLDNIEKYNLNSDYQIIPIVKNNLDFFKELVYLDAEEIIETPLSKREIFIRQSINLNDFGRLTILPDGKAYSNVNHHPLGTIKNLPIELVQKEFTKGESWFNLRKQKPCSECIYQWICPSPSNIELAIGKNNLCTIKV